jgi:hypothetical protein
MVEAALVTAEIEAGRRIFERLSQAKDLRLEAAFWWREEEEWRFVIATPIVHEEGRLPAHRRIREALEADATRGDLKILDRLDVLSPSEELITVLDVGSQGQVPLRRLIVRENVRSVYVDGGYFYQFAPKTFAPA